MSVSLVLLGIRVLRRGRRAAGEQRPRGQRPLQGYGAVRQTNVHAGPWAAAAAGPGSGAVNTAFGVAAGAGLPLSGAHKQKRRRRTRNRRRRRRHRRGSPPPAGDTNETGLVDTEIAVAAVAVADNSERDKHSSLDHVMSRALQTLTRR